MPHRPILALAVLAAVFGALATPASAEDQDAIREKIKQQMEKIIRLMRENETALLVASTGGKADPKGPEVVVPPAEEAGAEGTGTPSGGERAGTDPGARGEEVRRRIERLLEGQGRRATSIPKEIEDLVKMIPT
jgi:hypothetical protein